MTHVRTTVLVLLMAGLAGVMAPAHSQEARSGGGAASAELVAELQQLSAERSALKSQNEQLQQQLVAVKAERDRLRQGARSSDLRARSSAAALASSKAEEQSSEQKLAQMQANVQQLIAKFRQVVDTLRKTEVEEANAKQTLALREQDLSSCTEHNQALYKLDEEVLAHFEKQGFWSRLAADEPFTRIERVRLENYADESRGRAEDQRYAPPAGAIPSK
jgi:chromosome segregation ATPase